MYVWVFISNVADAQCVLKNNSLQLMGGRMCPTVLLSQRMYVHLFLRQVAQSSSYSQVQGVAFGSGHW